MKFTPPFPATDQLRSQYIRSDLAYYRGKDLFEMNMCSVLPQQDDRHIISVQDRFEDFQVSISLADHTLSHQCSCSSIHPCCHHTVAALLFLSEVFDNKEAAEEADNGIPYTREEMIQRVLQEREERARSEQYQVILADNIHGIHQLTTHAGRQYHITIRDFDQRSGYCSCPDFQTSKLGTCKHLIFLLNKLHKEMPIARLTELQPFPFVEIFCDPLNDYQISYFYKDALTVDIASLLEKGFKGKKVIEETDYRQFTGFLEQAATIRKILVRPEVQQKIDRYFQQRLLEQLATTIKPDFSILKRKLLPYQEEGVRFSLFKAGSIIADEMGLGKSAQAIAVALLKRQIFDFRRVLIICPASLKQQWQQEIGKLTDLPAQIIEGNSHQRSEQYRQSEAFFIITNYKAVISDQQVINQRPPDLIILDEAQRIKNYTTKTSYAVKGLEKRHALVLTGTPIENRLGDLYSIMNFIDPQILAPLWEFSMQHCHFDRRHKDRITGYYNLKQLRERISPWLIRRERHQVLDQLPELQEIEVPVNLYPEQMEHHGRLSRALGGILQKKYKTSYDVQRIQQLLQSMRMICNSTFLVDKETNHAAKLEELQEILLEKLDIVHQKTKVIIFSEWKTMLSLIEKLLQNHRLKYQLISGDVPVTDREAVLNQFRQDPECCILLSTETGGTGLNLQTASTIINTELPWNPARLQQRLGRINRLGQENQQLTVINLVARNTIEQRIAEGLELKDSLFDAVLNTDSDTDIIDFAEKGKSAFIGQVQDLIAPFRDERTPADESEEQSQSRRFRMPKLSEQLPLFDDGREKPAALHGGHRQQQPTDFADLENALQNGYEFINGLLKLAGGKTKASQKKKIEINKKTGEVILRFNIPGFDKKES